MAKVMKALQTIGLPGPPPQAVQRSEAQPTRRGLGSSGSGSKGSSGHGSSGQSTEELMACKVCQRTYSTDADGRRLPRDLTCGHVFCQRCLTDCMSGAGNKCFVPCPVCKKKTNLIGSNVLELPVNRQILSIVRSNKPHRHHHQHSHSQSESRQVRLDDGRTSGDRERKSCSCDHGKIVPEKQVVVKSAMKKLRVNDGGSQNEDHTAVVKAPARLHPPPKGSQYAVTQAILEDGGSSSIGSCTDLEDRGTSAEPRRQLSPCVEEEIEVISNEVAPVLGSKYPLQELHEMAPQSLVDDLNLANGRVDDVREHVTGGRGVDYSVMSSLTDMLQLQPTTAAYISSFGRYSEVRAYPGDFCGPSRISCSKGNKVMVVDRDHESVQAFSTSGESLANFSVPQITGGCFLDESNLAVSSPRGIELYRFSGRLLLTIPLGLTVAVARHLDGGFVAAQPTRVSIGRNPTTTVQLHTITSVRQAGKSKRSFIDITDVAVGRSGNIVVLDDQSVLVIDQDGNLQALIDPINQSIGSASAHYLPDEVTDLFKPFSIAVDPLSDNVVVCDSQNRCISAYAVPGGGFVRCLVNFRDQVENDQIMPHGIAINGVGQLFIALRSQGLAEVAIYNI